MNRHHSLPEIDDPADSNPRGKRHRDILEPDYNDEPAMPNWSWAGLAVLMIAGGTILYLCYRFARAVYSLF